MKKLLVSIVLLPLLTAGCHRSMTGIKGSGKRVTEKRQIAPFTSIATDGAFNIEVVCQKDVGMEVEGDDNVLAHVSTEVTNNVLRLKNTESYSVDEPVTFRITVPNLEAFSANGAGKIQISAVNNEKLIISSDGAAAINVSGNTKMLGIDTNGASKIDTHNLRAPEPWIHRTTDPPDRVTGHRHHGTCQARRCCSSHRTQLFRYSPRSFW